MQYWWSDLLLRITQAEYDRVIERCLTAYLEAGTPELSLDRLAYEVGVSKRMLVHYFGNREGVEERAIRLFEEWLRSQFHPDTLPTDLTLGQAVRMLWERITAPELQGHLRLRLNLCRRAWDGSARGQQFYLGQQRIWAELLGRYSEDQGLVGALLQLLEGAAIAFAITADPEPGRLALERLASS